MIELVKNIAKRILWKNYYSNDVYIKYLRKGGLKLEMELSSIALVKDQLMRAHYRMLKLGNIVE